MRALVPIVLMSSLLAACETPLVAPRYTAAADASTTLRSMGASGVEVRSFEGPSTLGNCRGLKPLALPDGISPTQYIQRAFEAEFKAVGALAEGHSRVTLSGRVEAMSFSSTKAITMGEWSVALLLHSTNGQTMRVQESMEFDSAFEAGEACQNTANAFAQVVQNLVRKSVQDPTFAGLLR